MLVTTPLETWLLMKQLMKATATCTCTYFNSKSCIGGGKKQQQGWLVPL